MPPRPRETNRPGFARAEEDRAISRARAGSPARVAQELSLRSTMNSLHHPIVLLADAKEDERPCERKQGGAVYKPPTKNDGGL